jgi:hypothetical protein
MTGAARSRIYGTDLQLLTVEPLNNSKKVSVMVTG